MAGVRRMLEPEVSVTLYDSEHVTVVASVRGSRLSRVELVLEDAALAELYLTVQALRGASS